MALISESLFTFFAICLERSIFSNRMIYILGTFHYVKALITLYHKIGNVQEPDCYFPNVPVFFA